LPRNAELVQNRSFEHAEHLYAWATVNRAGQGTVTVESADPLNAGREFSHAFPANSLTVLRLKTAE
jgi:hypothetical protein